MEDEVRLEGFPTTDDDVGETSWLRRVAEALRAPSIVQAPQSVIDCARTAFVERRRRPGEVVHVARPLYDSWASLAPASIRGEAASTRHQVFSTAWHDVDLWGERLTDDLWYLIGQVLPKEGGAAIRPIEALLVSSDKSVKTGVPDNGEFHIPSVHPGTYDLRLRLSGAEVLLPNVQVGA